MCVCVSVPISVFSHSVNEARNMNFKIERFEIDIREQAEILEISSIISPSGNLNSAGLFTREENGMSPTKKYFKHNAGTAQG